MPSWLSDWVGTDMAPLVYYALVAAIVLALIVIVLTVARKVLGINTGPKVKGRGPRLAVMDVSPIDAKRKLVLVRRDEIEHLLLIGGQNDLVVEAGILRIPASIRQGRSEPNLSSEFDYPAAPAAVRAAPSSARPVAAAPPPAAGAPRGASPLTRSVPRPVQATAPISDRPVPPVAEPPVATPPPVAAPVAAPPVVASPIVTPPVVTPIVAPPVVVAAPVRPPEPAREEPAAAKVPAAKAAVPAVESPVEPRKDPVVEVPKAEAVPDLPTPVPAATVVVRPIVAAPVPPPPIAAEAPAPIAAPPPLPARMSTPNFATSPAPGPAPTVAPPVRSPVMSSQPLTRPLPREIPGSAPATPAIEAGGDQPKSAPFVQRAAASAPVEPSPARVVPPAPPIQPRSMATPTYPVRPALTVEPPVRPGMIASGTGNDDDDEAVSPPRSSSEPSPEAVLARLLAKANQPSTTAPPIDLGFGPSDDRNVAPTAVPPSLPAPMPDVAQADPSDRRPLSVRSFASAIQGRQSAVEVTAPPPPAPSTPISGDAVIDLPPPPPTPLPASAPMPTSGSFVKPVTAAATFQTPATSWDDEEDDLEDFLSAQLDDDLGEDIWVSKDEPTPSVESEVPAPSKPEPEPEPEPEHVPEAARSDPPAKRQLTLEEEMERLLGDFDLETSERRQR